MDEYIEIHDENASANQDPIYQEDLKPPMALAIITCVCCCVPLGIVSIIYASKVEPLVKCGRYYEAREYVRKSKSWACWGIVLGAIVALLSFLAQCGGAFLSSIIQNGSAQ